MNADFNFLIVLRSLSLKGFHLIAQGNALGMNRTMLSYAL